MVKHLPPNYACLYWIPCTGRPERFWTNFGIVPRHNFVAFPVNLLQDILNTGFPCGAIRRIIFYFNTKYNTSSKNYVFP